MEQKLYQIVTILKRGYSRIRIDDGTVTCYGSESELHHSNKKHHR